MRSPPPFRVLALICILALLACLTGCASTSQSMQPREARQR
jgi:hypothetical protein